MAGESGAVYIGKVCTWKPESGIGVVDCIDIDAPHQRVPITKDQIAPFAASLQEQGIKKTRVVGLRVSFQVQLNQHGAPQTKALQLAPWQLLELPVFAMDGRELCRVSIRDLNTVAMDLKRQIEDAVSIPRAIQALALDGTVLQDGSRLSGYDCLLRRATQLSLTKVDVVSPEVEKLKCRDNDVSDRLEALEELSRLVEAGAVDETEYSTVLASSLEEEEEVQIRSEIISKLAYPLRGGSATIDALKRAALLDADEDVRCCAAGSLACPMVPSGYDLLEALIVSALEEILHSGPDGSTRRNALQGLEKSDRAKALQLSTSLAINDDDDDVRECAVEVLSNLADTSSIPTLLQVLEHDTSEYVVAKAAQALGTVGDVADGSVVTSLIHAFERVLAQLGTVTSTARLVKSAAAYGIIRALGELGDERAVPPLETVLQDVGLYEWSFYVTVAVALGKLGQKSLGARALLQVIQLPESRGTNCISVAAQALGELGDGCAIPELQKLLEVEEHEDYPFHVEVAEALAKMDDALGICTLRSILMSQNIGRSLQAADALGSIGTVEACEALQKAAADHREGEVRERSSELLETCSVSSS